ncbi:MAG: hypothetical protein H7A46_12820 [Verrucomicrobiales bacterium]|nr:hypothetical protein [Verrucomicrobiales bacterium]
MHGPRNSTGTRESRESQLPAFLRFATDPGSEQWRVFRFERDIVLIVKGILLVILFYYLFLTNWMEDPPIAHQEIFLETARRMAQRVVQYSFLLYTAINIALAFVMLGSRELTPRVTRLLVAAIAFLDAAFLAGMVLVTGGVESSLFWVFPLLIARNALVLSPTTRQILLNLLTCGACAAATIGAAYIQQAEDTSYATIRLMPFASLSELPDSGIGLVLIGQNRTNHTLHFRVFDREARALIDASEAGFPDKQRQVAILKNLLEPLWEEPTLTADQQDAILDAVALITGQTQAAGPPALDLGLGFWLRMGLLIMVMLWLWGIRTLLERELRREEEQTEMTFRRGQMDATARLAAEIAHKLKNPLAIINNASYTLQRTVKEGKGTITQQIQIIREEVDRSDRLITELMGFAQLAEGRVERVDVKEEIERAIQQVFPPALKFQVRIHRDYGAGVPPLTLQRQHLTEALVNLLHNAREVMGGRGNIWISTRATADQLVRINVTDDGPGIPPENLNRIFEPYFTTRDKGSGLGLAIVTHNVGIYGGNVSVESEVGRGSSFTLEFPFKSMMRLRK